jgi:hypothetical protein
MNNGSYMTTTDNPYSDLTITKCQSTFPKPTLHQKKDMVTVWWSAAGVITYNFLNPGEAITAEKYH